MSARQDFSPRSYQGAIIDHALDIERAGIWAGMGMGKTVSTLTALDVLEIVEPGPALVVAPLRVASSTWPDEARKWNHLRNIEVSAVVGTPDERRAALRRPASVYTTNYEQLPWLVEHFGDKWPFKKIVADESTKLKGFRLRQGTQRAQALARVAHAKASRFIELTGTPSPNGLQDLWGQAWFLDKGQRLGLSFTAFENRWFTWESKRELNKSAESRVLVPTPTAQRMRPCGSCCSGATAIPWPIWRAASPAGSRPACRCAGSRTPRCH